MADGTIRIGLELEDGGIKSEAKAAGSAAGDAAGSGLEQGIDQGSKSGADKAGANIESFGDKMKGVLAGISVAALAASIGELVSTTNEFQEDMGKLSVAAQQNSVSAGEANKAYRDMVGILGETDQSVEAVNHLFALCGDNTQALSDWTNIASGVYASFGDSLPLEGLTEAANETARVGQVTGPFADAINWATASAEELGGTLDGNVAAQDAFYAAIDGGATVEDAYTAALQACSDEGERAQVITDTLTGLYGEAGEQYQQTNEDVINYRQSQSDLTQAMSDLGQAFMPVVTGVTNMAAALVSGLQPAADWFVQNLPIIAPILAGIATAVGILTVASMAQSAATTIAATAQGLLNAALSANPIVLVVALIAGLIAAIVLLWNNSEAFRNFVTGAFDAIMSVAQTVIDAIVNFFTATVPNAIGVVVGFFQNLWNTIVSVFNGALSTVSGFVGNVVSFFTSDVPNGIMNMLSAAGQIPGQIASFLGDALSSAWNFVGNFAGAAIDAASQFVSNIINGLSDLGWKVVSVGSNIVSGIWEGISGASGWLMSQISGFADSVVGGIKGFFGIASPSKVMRDEVGRYLAEGVAVGWEDNDPLSSIERDMKVGVSKLSVQAQAVDGIGVTTNNQTINFNQPVETPDQIARTMRLQQRYGLAGSYV